MPTYDDNESGDGDGGGDAPRPTSAIEAAAVGFEAPEAEAGEADAKVEEGDTEAATEEGTKEPEPAADKDSEEGGDSAPEIQTKTFDDVETELKGIMASADDTKVLG